MVIDLTLDDTDPEDLPGPPDQPKPEPKSHPSFFSNLAHRLNSLSPFTIPGTVSGKRKRESESSDSSEPEVIKSASASTASRLSHNGVPHHNHLHNNNVFGARLAPATPSPSPGLPDRFSLPRVVVPPPPRHLKKEIASADWPQPLDDSNITGLSEKFYPTDAFDVRARKGAYPAARRVDRADVPLSVGRRCGPILSKRPVVQDQLRNTLRRKLDRLHGPKVTVAPQDEHALALVTANFEFINSYKLQKGVAPADPGFDCGCNCGPICDPERCLCLDEEGDSDQEDDGGSWASEDQNNRTIVSYQCAPDSDEIVLTPEFLKRTARIAECGRLCGCDENCWNRVVQRGRTVRLEIFDTGNRGFGLRSPDAIRAGQFIDCYLGEVVTREQADVREELAIKHGHSYLFSLDFSPEATEDKMYVVDGQRYGSPTRFMNHSCNPNCRMFPVSHTHADHNLYDLAFFALRDIPPRTELTFDYNPGAKQAQASIDPNAVRCLCMEKNCRGQLWPNQRKGTK